MFLKLLRSLCDSFCFGLLDPICIGVGSVKNAGIVLAALSAIDIAPDPGAPGLGASPPVVYTVDSGRCSGDLYITLCLLSTFKMHSAVLKMLFEK